MGQKVRPTGFRVGVMITWRSQWSASTKKEFPELLVEDKGIRDFIKKEYRAALISLVRIERTREKCTVFIHAAKVGSIIGQKGAKIDELTEKLKDMFNREIEVKTIEVHRPQSDPQILAQEIADNLEKRQSFRRTLKRSLEQAWTVERAVCVSKCPVVLVDLKWHGVRAACWVVSHFRRSELVLITASLKRQPHREISASRFG